MLKIKRINCITIYPSYNELKLEQTLKYLLKMQWKEKKKVEKRLRNIRVYNSDVLRIARKCFQTVLHLSPSSNRYRLSRSKDALSWISRRVEKYWSESMNSCIRLHVWNLFLDSWMRPRETSVGGWFQP